MTYDRRAASTKSFVLQGLIDIAKKIVVLGNQYVHSMKGRIEVRSAHVNIMFDGEDQSDMTAHSYGYLGFNWPDMTLNGTYTSVHGDHEREFKVNAFDDAGDFVEYCAKFMTGYTP